MPKPDLDSWGWSDSEIRDELADLDRSKHKLDTYELEFIENVVFKRKNDKLTRPQREFALNTFMKYGVDIGED